MPADSVFIIGGGVVVSYKELRQRPAARRRVSGFTTDIFGLAEDGAYVNTTRAVTAVTVFRIPAVDAHRDPQARRGARVSVPLQGRRQPARGATQVDHRRAPRCGGARGDVPRPAAADSATRSSRAAGSTLPMTRSDIGGFLNLTLESVSRACRRLSDQGIVDVRPRRRADRQSPPLRRAGGERSDLIQINTGRGRRHRRID